MKSNYFSIKELVCKHVYDRYGEAATMFIDDRLIATLNTVREKILRAPMTVNNWHLGGSFTQRGLRCNLCDLVREKSERQQLYLSAHWIIQCATTADGEKLLEEIKNINDKH